MWALGDEGITSFKERLMSIEDHTEFVTLYLKFLEFFIAKPKAEGDTQNNIAIKIEFDKGDDNIPTLDAEDW
jgi:hypothetical protein